MGGLHGGNLDSPDEVREVPKGRIDLIRLGDVTVGRSTFEPGWRWSESVKEIVGTETCESHHVGYALSGKLHVVSDGGEEADVAAGDAYVVMPGHDAWVVGDEPFVGLEFQSAETYAKK
jgi:hypothetical protein